jgi:lysophospholipase L1-like esterase
MGHLALLVYSMAGSMDPIIILPLGDSITSNGNEHKSYRYYLWRGLLEHYGQTTSIDFVGSQRNNYGRGGGSKNPEWATINDVPFDQDHEGHWGWRTDEILSKIDSFLPQYTPPSLTLIHLGTNDCFSQQSAGSTAEELSALVAKLRNRNPAMTIILSKLIPAIGPNWINTPFIDAVNNMIPGLAETLSTTESMVKWVDPAMNGWDIRCAQASSSDFNVYFTCMLVFFLPLFFFSQS